MKKHKYKLYFLIWGVVWELLARLIIKDTNIFPPLSLVSVRLIECIKGANQFPFHLSQSFWRFLVALTLSFPLAVSFSFFSSKKSIVGEFVHFFFSATYAFPKVAIFPFLILIFGIGDGSKVILIALGMFYIFYLNMRQGIDQLRASSYYDLITTYKIRGFGIFLNFYIKGTLSYIFAGLKSGMGYGLVLVVVSEMSFSTNGLGFYMWHAWDQFRVIDMFVALTVLSFWGYLNIAICEGLERKATRAGLLYR